MKPVRMKHRGFTLIELMVVLAIIAIMLMLAAPSFQRTITQQKISTVASDLLASIMQARGEAIKNNQQTMITPLDSTNWSKGWRIFVDMDNDKAYTEGTDTLITTAPAAADNIVQDAADFFISGGNYIGFTSTGYLLNRNAARIVFSANPSIDIKKGIKLSAIGRPRICVSKTGSDGCAASAVTDY
jgi:type IV fimbrial biogenesis protein FimT